MKALCITSQMWIRRRAAFRNLKKRTRAQRLAIATNPHDASLMQMMIRAAFDPVFSPIFSSPAHHFPGLLGLTKPLSEQNFPGRLRTKAEVLTAQRILFSYFLLI